eukprot:NODE_4849_length_1839_cov_3.641355.p1 GENE.NODE_4849_length_1839_cov_3.641355~~NODE_4849_length_1839_cov_3.641355.p1  ORF type:complete len:517 (+),score=120.48 NODE_4849_length_1839_cov_3.641355:159-1709(+)
MVHRSSKTMALLGQAQSGVASMGDDSHLGRGVSHHGQAHGHKMLGVGGVMCVSFFNVAGGPFGSEGLFVAGPLWGLIGLVTFALFLAAPQCLVTLELCCAIPSNGGFSVWAQKAFGDFWGMQMCYWRWAGGVIDNALYPVIICDSVAHLTHGTPVGEFAGSGVCRVMLTIALACPLFFSSTGVQNCLAIIMPIVLVPLLIFTCIAAPAMDTSSWGAGFTWESISLHWRDLVMLLFWSLEGWDCVSTCVTMVERPLKRPIASGLVLGLGVCVATYAVVLLVADGATKTVPGEYVPGGSGTRWADGMLPHLAAEAVGAWMGTLLMIAAVGSNAGMYMAELFEDAYLLQGAAEAGLVPKIFAWTCCQQTRSNERDVDEGGSDTLSGVPLFSIAFEVAIMIVFTSFDFSTILVFDNAFCASSVALEFMSYVRLRWTQPALERPVRLPALMMLLLLLPGICLTLFIFYLSLTTAESRTQVASISGAFAVGIPLGLWSKRRAEAERAAGLDVVGLNRVLSAA